MSRNAFAMLGLAFGAIVAALYVIAYNSGRDAGAEVIYPHSVARIVVEGAVVGFALFAAAYRGGAVRVLRRLSDDGEA